MAEQKKKECPEQNLNNEFFGKAFVAAQKKIYDATKAVGGFITRAESPVFNKAGYCTTPGIVVIDAIEENVIGVLNEIVENQGIYHMNIVIRPIKGVEGRLKLAIYFEPMEY